MLTTLTTYRTPCTCPFWLDPATHPSSTEYSSRCADNHLGNGHCIFLGSFRYWFKKHIDILIPDCIEYLTQMAASVKPTSTDHHRGVGLFHVLLPYDRHSSVFECLPRSSLKSLRLTCKVLNELVVSPASYSSAASTPPSIAKISPSLTRWRTIPESAAVCASSSGTQAAGPA